MGRQANRIFIAGHKGMVGSAIVRRLQAQGHEDLIVRERSKLDLSRQAEVEAFFQDEKVDQVYLAAARVGGIKVNNDYPADFIYDNLVIQANIINAAYRAGVNHLLFLGSSCIYPRDADQPMREEALLTGSLEPTNEPYAVAKIAGIKLCESFNRQYGCDYRSVMPTNLYGPGDNFHPENSHVIPGLIRRFHTAKEAGDRDVTVWGTGRPRREFLHVDDLAAACLHVMDLPRKTWDEATEPMLSHLNIGTGKDCTIQELAELIREVVGYEGKVAFDTSKPDGTPRKLLDISKIKMLGWEPTIPLEEGLKGTYRSFLESPGRAV